MGNKNFKKHVVDGAEFNDLGVITKKDFQNHIENIVSKPSDIRYHSDGRVVYLDNSTRTIVIRNPNGPEGTAFRIKSKNDWDDYINNIVPSRTSPY